MVRLIDGQFAAMCRCKKQSEVGVESQTGDLCQQQNHTTKQKSEREIVFRKGSDPIYH